MSIGCTFNAEVPSQTPAPNPPTKTNKKQTKKQPLLLPQQPMFKCYCEYSINRHNGVSSTRAKLISSFLFSERVKVESNTSTGGQWEKQTLCALLLLFWPNKTLQSSVDSTNILKSDSCGVWNTSSWTQLRCDITPPNSLLHLLWQSQRGSAVRGSELNDEERNGWQSRQQIVNMSVCGRVLYL